ncbi:glycosyltransferase [Desulfosoma sp.]
MATPRVLHVGKYYPPYPGGMERFLGDLLGALAGRGLAGLALVHHHQARWDFHRPPQPHAPMVMRVPSYGQCFYTPISPLFPLAFKKVLAHFNPELIHMHLPNPSAFWALSIPEARRRPWVIHWHADVVAPQGQAWMEGLYRVYRLAEKKLLAKACAVVVTSPPYLKTSKPLAAWQSKTCVIPLGVNPARLPWPEAPVLNEARSLWGSEAFLRVLAVGRLSPYKGFQHLIAAAARVPFLRVLIVGAGPQAALLRSFIQRWKLADRVHLLGYRSDAQMQALMATCDLLCLPSTQRTEAFGLVLLEAMRYEKPALATSIPGSGVTWVVHHHETGWLVPPGDPEALAETLRGIGLQRARLHAMGRKAKERFDAAFHIDKVADRMLSLYGAILGQLPNFVDSPGSVKP